MDGRTRHLPLLALLALAACLRLLYLWELRGSDLLHVPILDAETSLAWASDLAAGHWGRGSPYWMAPLYPHLLAPLVALFGASTVAPVVVQMLLGLVNLVLLHRLVLRVADGRTAFWATALWAGYAPAFFHAGFLIVATVLTTIVLWITGRMLRCRAAPCRRDLLLLGVAIGVGGLARGNVLLLVPASLLLWTDAPRAAALRRLAWVALGTVLCIAPVTLRNIVVGGDPVLLTSNAGMNLAIGQDASSEGVFNPLHSDPSGRYDPTGRARLEEELGRELRPSEVSSIYTGRALAAVRDDPVGWAVHTLRKAARLWNGYELPQLAAFSVRRETSTALRLAPVTWWLLATLGLVGLTVLRGDARRVVLVVLGAYALSLLPFFPTARYRLPMAPLLALPAAALLVAWVADVRAGEGWTRPWRLRAGAVGALAVLLWPGWGRLDADQVRWQAMVHDASRAERAGRPADAARLLADAGALLPDLPDTWYHLGQLHRRDGDDHAAAAAFAAGEALAPDDRLFPYHLGRLHLRQDRPAEAVAAYRRSLTVDPDWAKSVFGLGMALRAAGDVVGADSLFVRAVVLAPGNPRYRNNLALTKAALGAGVEAEAILVDLVTDFPGYARGWINLGLIRLGRGDREGAAAAVAALDGLELSEAEARNREALREAIRGPAAG